MRSPSRSLALVACLSLVALQASGLHIHVDEHGYLGAPQGTHSHTHSAHATDDGRPPHAHGPSTGHAGDAHTVSAGHGGTAVQDPGYGAQPHEHAAGGDFDDAEDVSLLELGAAATKLVLALLCLTFVLALLPQKTSGSFGPPAVAILTGRRSRWRPPLRAPPRHSHA